MANRKPAVDYDEAGRCYGIFRSPDSRIAAFVDTALQDMNSVVNIGAGTGSYEPCGKVVSALEPSLTMIRQRTPRANTTICQAVAEQLPFRTKSHDAATAFLTIHHWQDWRQGLIEARRVARKKIVLLTWTGMPKGFWLYDYLPQIKEADRALFPSIEQISAIVGAVDVTPIPIPADCTDGFLCAYWARPEKYLDVKARSAISTFARDIDTQAGLSRLRKDLDNGTWRAKHGHLLKLDDFDYGYRLLVAQLPD